MRNRTPTILLQLIFLLSVTESCNRTSSINDPDPPDTSKHLPDTNKHYYTIDSGFYMEPAITQPEIEYFKKTKNLLEFHTKDSMNTNSTYIATLSMGKDMSSAEMEKKVKAITEPGGRVQVKDTTLEISLRMAATLEDKASSDDPNFRIRLIGGENNNVRAYDAKKNKIVWQWNVTPVKPGNHELILSVSQLDSFGYVAGSPETRRHYITIFSETKQGGFGKKLSVFFGNNWQWLIGAVLIPLIIVWINIWYRAKAQAQAKSSSSKPARNGKRRKRN